MFARVALDLARVRILGNNCVAASRSANACKIGYNLLAIAAQGGVPAESTSAIAA